MVIKMVCTWRGPPNQFVQKSTTNSYRSQYYPQPYTSHPRQSPSKVQMRCSSALFGARGCMAAGGTGLHNKWGNPALIFLAFAVWCTVRASCDRLLQRMYVPARRLYYCTRTAVLNMHTSMNVRKIRRILRGDGCCCCCDSGPSLCRIHCLTASCSNLVFSP